MSEYLHQKEKIQVDIWSDVVCPFCYIGKRNFEKALAQFAHHDNVEVTWKSFQLDPDMPAHVEKSVFEYLAKRKGITLEQSKQMHDHVIEMAKNAGLNYNFDIAVMANSFDAHRLIQMAKKNNLVDAAEESLFKAYFIEGKNIADHEILAKIGQDIGLQIADLESMLKSNTYADAVQNDIAEATELGINGVPYFVINRKYGISGAQPPEVFLQAFEKIQLELFVLNK